MSGMDGNQAAYIFNVTTDAFTQALVDPSQSGSPAITFAAGQQYTITIAAAVAEAAPGPTDELLFGLYYTDTGGQEVVAQTILRNDGTQGLSSTQFNDYSAVSSVLDAADPAVGQQITVQVSAIGGGGGEFDFDNVRVSDVPEPASLAMLGLGAMVLLTRGRCRGPCR